MCRVCRQHPDAPQASLGKSPIVACCGLLAWQALAMLEVVGVRGFEPPASASRTQRSTGLSHTPTGVPISCLRDYYSRISRLFQLGAAGGIAKLVLHCINDDMIYFPILL